MRGVEFVDEYPLFWYAVPAEGQHLTADQALADVAEWLGFDVSEDFNPFIYLNALEHEEELIFERATY